MFYYVDQFGDPMDIWYVSTTDWIFGTFSNSATTNSDLYARLLYDKENGAALALVEYGFYPVTNSSSRYNEKYWFTIKNEDGDVLEFRGLIYPGGNRIYIVDAWEEEFMDMLKSSEMLKFHIKNEEFPTTQYRFDVYMTNFNEILEEMLDD